MSVFATIYQRLSESTELPWRALLLGVFVVGGLMISVGKETDDENGWHTLYWYGAMLILTAQMSHTTRAFFMGEGPSIWDFGRYFLALDGDLKTVQKASKSDTAARKRVGFLTLMPSTFITWIFAKSINNSATLGGRFGLLGGIAYAGWYVSFFAAALVGYQLRTRYGFRSLPAAIERCYGTVALLCFSLALLYRLWNEVWSNSVVVASFYGKTHSHNWWVAVAVSTMIPAFYTTMGGMRASLFSDGLQAFLGLVFLFVILGLIGDKFPDGINQVWEWEPSGGWLPGGGYCLLAALLQGFGSYPFHDPVLTDRAFLAKPRVMLVSFLTGGCLAVIFIVLFSAVGIADCYVKNEANLADGLPAVVAGKCGSPASLGRALGSAAFTWMNLVMMTSSMSTLDSTFTSVAKLAGLEFAGYLHLPGDTRGGRRGPMDADNPSVTPLNIAIGRLAILALAVVGSLNLLSNTEALSATTVSGTMVMGLGPPVYLLLLWKYNSQPGSGDGYRKAPLAFLFSFVPGIVFGAIYSAATIKDPEGVKRNPDLWDDLQGFNMGEGMYKTFLGVNVVGHLVCFAGTVIGFLLHQYVPALQLDCCDGEATTEDPKTDRKSVV